MVYSCPSYAASSLLLLSLALLTVASAVVVITPSYVRKSIDSGLVVMPLPHPVSGPESLAFTGDGDGPYAAVSDGRILRWQGHRLGWTVFAYNSRHKSVGMCSADKKLVVPESLCGRPLALQFDHKSGDLYFADAYLGLMRVSRRGGLAEVVATEAAGMQFNFLNGLDIDQSTGAVYFTDSSTTYRRSQYLLVVAMGDETGRLLRYDPRTHSVVVLHDGLSFPNGVAIAADGTHVVVAHTGLSELRRYWVNGPKFGQFETFAEVPGYPDNVRSDSQAGYWVALWQLPDVPQAAPTVAVRVNARDGVVKEALKGFSFMTVSEVAERNGTLWVGSVDTPYAGELIL